MYTANTWYNYLYVTNIIERNILLCLQVFDCRYLTTTSGMFEAICNHIKYATNKGNLRYLDFLCDLMIWQKYIYELWIYISCSLFILWSDQQLRYSLSEPMGRMIIEFGTASWFRMLATRIQTVLSLEIPWMQSSQRYEYIYIYCIYLILQTILWFDLWYRTFFNNSSCVPNWAGGAKGRTGIFYLLLCQRMDTIPIILTIRPTLSLKYHSAILRNFFSFKQNQSLDQLMRVLYSILSH